jgi:hypothetical protein
VIPALLDFDDAPSIGEVVNGGLGRPVRVSGGSYVVKVSLASGSEAVFVLSRPEYDQWLAHRPQEAEAPTLMMDAFGVVDRRNKRHPRYLRRR